MAKFPLTWDEEAQAGYIYLRASEDKVATTVECAEDGRFLIDLDQFGRVVGIEFLSDVPVSALMACVKGHVTHHRGEAILDW